MPDAERLPVEQKERLFGFARQHTLYDRQNRRDAGARREADIDSRLVRRMRDAEAAVGVMTSSSSPGLQLVRGPIRECAAIDLLHGNAEFAVIGTGADE